MKEEALEFLLQCLSDADSKARNKAPRPLNDNLSLGGSDEMEIGGLVEGGHDHRLVLVDHLIRSMSLETAASCSGEVVA